MKAQRKLTHVFSGSIAALALGWCADRPAEATEPSGVTVTVINQATVPEFDARRRYREESTNIGRRPGRIWKLELEATRMIQVVTALFTVQPGGHSGWHTHPGPAIFTIKAGTLTMYDGDDPSCTPQLFPAGTGSIEADTGAHIHMLRNETGSVAETVVTFLMPVGSLLRTDLPDPGNCPF
jgi:hypothetical protein